MGTMEKKYSLRSGHHHLLHTQPLLSEVFTYDLRPRQLSRDVAMTGGLSRRHRPSPLFGLATFVLRLRRPSHTSLGAAMGRS